MRVGVSNGILKECLVELGKRNKFEIEEYWYGFSFPFKNFFKWLNGDKLPKEINTKELFHSFMLANQFDQKMINKLDVNHYLAEFKWDGIRAQIVFSESGKIYSRSGEDITLSFPELNYKNEKLCVIDGELVIKKIIKFFLLTTFKKELVEKNYL